jgi:hypothetical protein
MAALCVRVLRAQTVVGVADERGRRGGGHESLACDGVYPVGRAGTSGKIMRDGLRISRVLSHQAKERRDGGPRVAEAFIHSLLFTHLRTRSQSTEPFPVFLNVFSTRSSFLIFSSPFSSLHSPWLHPARCIMHLNTHLTGQPPHSSQTGQVLFSL